MALSLAFADVCRTVPSLGTVGSDMAIGLFTSGTNDAAGEFALNRVFASGSGGLKAVEQYLRCLKSVLVNDRRM